MTFLAESWRIIHGSDYDPSRTTIILPSGRACRVISSLIASSETSSLYISPEIITLSEWIDQLDPTPVAHPLQLSTELFKAIDPGLLPKHLCDPLVFYPTGQMLIRDFNELDQYLVSAADIFQNLRNLKELEEFSFLDEPLSPEQSEYLEFFGKIGTIYEAFQQRLDQLNLSYSGRKMRALASKTNYIANRFKGHQLWFVGFNALTTAEEKIIGALVDEDLAQVIWDIDSYYLDKEYMEAGKFFVGKGIDGYHFVDAKLTEHPPSIRIIQTQGLQSQVNTSIELLKSDPNTPTLVMLADETLFKPLLDQLIQEKIPFNSSVGLYTHQSNWHSLLKQVIHMQKQYLQDVPLTRDECKRVVENELLTWSEPGIRLDLLFVSEITTAENIQKTIGTAANRWPYRLLQPWGPDHKQWLEELREFAQHIPRPEQTSHIPTALDSGFATALIKEIDWISKYQEHNNIDIPLEIICQHLLKVSGEEMLTLKGSPGERNQIMGMLETRALDFSRVILVGANEGLMPAHNQGASFLTPSLRTYFGLPTAQKAEMIYAYYVYRLFHRSERVEVLFDDENSGPNSEMSRFILQLREELPLAVNDLTLHFANAQPKGVSLPKDSILKQTEKTQARLMEWAQKGISPSAIQTYLTCPKDFFINYVLSIRDVRSENNLVQNSDLGILVHYAMEQALAPHVGKVLTSNLEINEGAVWEWIKQKSVELYGLEPNRGLPYLNAYLAVLHVKKLLSISTTEPIDLIDLEREISCPLVVSLDNGSEMNVLIKGSADRIEKLGDSIRIIDYKTTASDKTMNIKQWSDILLPKNRYALQLAIYALCISKMYPQYRGKIKSELWFSTDGTSSDLKIEQVGVNYSIDDLDQIESLILSVIKEVLSSGATFEHHSKSEYCLFCE
ncbi:MAG TPA: PD-(D/E)XK nuclease family protein [Luteibaculaceae bacterium]|nr:PD-(D/E)XK nuclease family protein [Luteibaculaceae bacterium]